MNKIKIGIICPSEIAFRRFMPAMKKCENLEYFGVAYPTKEEWNNASEENIEQEYNKAKKFQEKYGGEVVKGYRKMVESPDIDSIYLPLPPGLHYQWAKKALNCNKHVFIEKPSTTNFKNTKELVELAKEKGLAIHENYMFKYHSQIEYIKEIINSGKIGKVRLIRGDFGFPKRESNDFRYNNNLGGGSLLDCGGYPLCLMRDIIGNDIHIDAASLFSENYNVDLYGSVQMSNSNSVAQISFGMDNSYRCSIDIWGSKGTLSTNRVFTAPADLPVSIKIVTSDGEKILNLDADDTFYKSICVFINCIVNNEIREQEYSELLCQANLVDQIKAKAGF